MLAVIMLSSCQQQEVKKRAIDDLSSLKSEFLNNVSSRSIEEGPFSLSYKYRSVFFSKNIMSFFGELTVHDRLPHGWKQYEGKSLYKSNGRWREIQLDDLFHTENQKKFLRTTCEKSLRSNLMSYFSGNNPLRITLEEEDVQTFVLDSQHLIIIFQPYSVGGCTDGPFVVKIPFIALENCWKNPPPAYSILTQAVDSDAYLSSWVDILPSLKGGDS
jgi:hypothetical protein